MLKQVPWSEDRLQEMKEYMKWRQGVCKLLYIVNESLWDCREYLNVECPILLLV